MISIAICLVVDCVFVDEVGVNGAELLRWNSCFGFDSNGQLAKLVLRVRLGDMVSSIRLGAVSNEAT